MNTKTLAATILVSSTLVNAPVFANDSLGETATNFLVQDHEPEESAMTEILNLIHQGHVQVDANSGTLFMKPSIIKKLRERGALSTTSIDRSSDTGGWKTK